MKQLLFIFVLGLSGIVIGSEEEIQRKEAEFKKRIIDLNVQINTTLSTIETESLNNIQEANRKLIELKNQANNIEQNNK